MGSSSAGFDGRELSDLARNMYRTAESLYPKQAKKFLQKEANKGRKYLRQETKKTTKKKTGNLLKGIGRTKVHTYEADNSLQIRVYNDAPHAHLIEHGHYNEKTKGRGKNIPIGTPVVMVPGNGDGPVFIGRPGVKRFFMGKHPAAKTTIRLKEEFPKDVEGFVDDLLKEGFEL